MSAADATRTLVEPTIRQLHVAEKIGKIMCRLEDALSELQLNFEADDLQNPEGKDVQGVFLPNNFILGTADAYEQYKAALNNPTTDKVEVAIEFTREVINTVQKHGGVI